MTSSASVAGSARRPSSSMKISANSSPPSRATMSDGPISSFSRLATSMSRASPAGCPMLSLTCLKWSMSIYISAKAQGASLVGKQRGDVVGEEAAVRQAGQRVMHCYMGDALFVAAPLCDVLRDADEIARLASVHRRDRALHGADGARAVVGAFDAFLEGQHTGGFHRLPVLLAEQLRLVRREDVVVGLADDVGRLETDDLAAAGIVEDVAAAILHVLDEHADRQAADDAVEQRARVARLAVRPVDLGAVGYDRQDRVDAVEAHVATIGQHLHHFAIGLEVLPALGTAKVGARLDGGAHALALAFRTDVQHGHAGIVLAAVAVELHRRVVDGQEAERLGIVDPHRRRVGDEERLEIFVLGRLKTLYAASGKLARSNVHLSRPMPRMGVCPTDPGGMNGTKFLTNLIY